MALFREAGVLLRPLGNTIYVMPPYCISAEDLTRVHDAIADAVAVVLKG
jgi:adenosylmethionine-8-amino-7-oxononanoate aminotransferase